MACWIRRDLDFIFLLPDEEGQACTELDEVLRGNANESSVFAVVHTALPHPFPLTQTLSLVERALMLGHIRHEGSCASVETSLIQDHSAI